MRSALAVTTLTNIPPDRYERMQEAIEEKLGAALTGDDGDVLEDKGDIHYHYDGSSMLTVSVIKSPKKFGITIPAQKVISEIEQAIQGIA